MADGVLPATQFTPAPYPQLDAVPHPLPNEHPPVIDPFPAPDHTPDWQYGQTGAIQWRLAGISYFSLIELTPVP